jgi:hypothetical protein
MATPSDAGREASIGNEERLIGSQRGAIGQLREAGE